MERVTKASLILDEILAGTSSILTMFVSTFPRQEFAITGGDASAVSSDGKQLLTTHSDTVLRVYDTRRFSKP
jgi:hypothetical protein